MSYSYRIYGLLVQTNEQLPSVATCTTVEGPDLQVQFVQEEFDANGFSTELLPGRPRSDGEPGLRVHRAMDRSERFWFRYPDGVEFVVDRPARTISASWPPHFCLEDATIYLLGPILGFYLRLLKTVSLHASVFEAEGKALALTGPAGGGKSTLVASFAAAGYTILNEDVAPLREVTGGFSVLPGYPLIRLWPSSVEHLFGSREAMPQLTPSWEKRSWSTAQGGLAFGQDPLPLKAIYVFAPRESRNAPRVEPLSPREALIELVGNTYVNYLLDRAQRAHEFEVLARLVARVPARRLVPHVDIARLPKLQECVLRDSSILAI